MFTLPGGVQGTGVTLPNGDTNTGNPSGYLQQCSTVPSEPGLGSGVCMTIQGFKAADKHDSFKMNYKNYQKYKEKLQKNNSPTALQMN